MSETNPSRCFFNKATICKTLTVMCAALALVAVYFLFIKKENKTKPRNAFTARIGPVEFLYLDSTRMLSYLAQLEGGRAGASHRITKQIESASAGVSASGAQAEVSSEQEDAVESTLAQVESSEMAILLKDLREDKVARISIHPVDLMRRSGLRRVREGWLVLFQTRYLRSPGYIRPYVVVNKAPTLAALFPEAFGNKSSERRAERQRAMARDFVGEIGLNPPVTFDISWPPHAPGRPVKILMPMQYADLTERSMFEEGRGLFSGGRLFVIGMVLRVFRGARGSSVHPAYIDFATREAWENPLKEASNYLINRVGHDCRTAWGMPEHPPPSKKIMKGRHCFLTKLRRQTRLAGPGAVVLPLAIFKGPPLRPRERPKAPANG